MPYPASKSRPGEGGRAHESQIPAFNLPWDGAGEQLLCVMWAFPPGQGDTGDTGAPGEPGLRGRKVRGVSNPVPLSSTSGTPLACSASAAPWWRQSRTGVSPWLRSTPG